MSAAAPWQLDAAGIAARIPHHGAMCLLDSVVSWSDNCVHCRASSHRHADNPLRDNGRLGIVNGIEYVAQAMAVHGALRAGQDSAPAAGLLASVREVCFHQPTLDVAADLDIHLECLQGTGGLQMYRFLVSAAGAPLISGRASAVLDATHR